MENKYQSNLKDFPNQMSSKSSDNFINELFDFHSFDIFSLARHGKYIELEALLLKGLNPDSKDENGNTILIIGAQNDNKRIIKISLRYGAQINMINSMGNSALHFASEYKYKNIYEYLIKKGANPELKNLRGVKARGGTRKINSNNNMMITSGKFTLTSSQMIESKDLLTKFEKIKNKIV
jgi:ankyrin repeat protein